MPREAYRNSTVDETTIQEMKNLFDTAKNAYRHLKLNDHDINMFTFQRACRLEQIRGEDCQIIEELWDDYKLRHNFTDELAFDPSSNIPGYFKRVSRRVQGQIIEEEAPRVGTPIEALDFGDE